MNLETRTLRLEVDQRRSYAPAETLRALQRLTSRFELRSYVGPIAQLLLWTEGNVVSLEVKCWVDDVKAPRTGPQQEPIQVRSTTEFWLDEEILSDDLDLFWRKLLYAIESATRHEIEEGFFVDSRQPFNPHAKEAKP